LPAYLDWRDEGEFVGGLVHFGVLEEMLGGEQHHGEQAKVDRVCVAEAMVLLFDLKAAVKKQLMFSQHSVNIQSTFSQHSVNIQSTLRTKAVNLQSTLSQHSVNKQSTFNRHSANTQSTFSEKQRNIQ
jgi:hypothetical protein